MNVKGLTIIRAHEKLWASNCTVPTATLLIDIVLNIFGLYCWSLGQPIILVWRPRSCLVWSPVRKKKSRAKKWACLPRLRSKGGKGGEEKRTLNPKLQTRLLFCCFMVVASSGSHFEFALSIQKTNLLHRDIDLRSLKISVKEYVNLYNIYM